MNTVQQGVISLLKSAVTGIAVELPVSFSLEEALEILSNQGLLPLAYQGALNSGIPRDLPVMRTLLAHYYRHMVRSERQMRDVQRILTAFTENDIDYMPLKGCVLKAMYPKPELRMMGDADILIKVEQLTQCGTILESLGFRLKLESDHTDNWQSEDLYVELHKSLVSPEDEDFYSYYGTGWNIAVKGQGCRYDLSPEDTFVFLVTHVAHHYRSGGIGCRNIVDLYVYHRAHLDMDEDYIRSEMQKLGLLSFHENILRLLSCWFEDQSADSITELMTAFIFSGGSWGSMEAELYATALKNVHRKGKVSGSGIQSLRHVLFPPLCVIQNRYQILRRLPVLLPAMWVVRWFDVLLFSRRKMRKKLQALRNLNDSSLQAYQQAMAAVGLEHR